jgi:hypothetical protein
VYNMAICTREHLCWCSFAQIKPHGRVRNSTEPWDTIFAILIPSGHTRKLKRPESCPKDGKILDAFIVFLKIERGSKNQRTSMALRPRVRTLLYELAMLEDSVHNDLLDTSLANIEYTNSTYVLNPKHHLNLMMTIFLRSIPLLK